LDKLIAEQTGLPVHVADDPLSAVAEGTGIVLHELNFLRKVAPLGQGLLGGSPAGPARSHSRPDPSNGPV
jgi:hypothetical protein